MRLLISLMVNLLRELQLQALKNLSRFRLMLLENHLELMIWPMLNSWLTYSMHSRNSTRKRLKRRRNSWRSKRPKRLLKVAVTQMLTPLSTRRQAMRQLSTALLKDKQATRRKRLMRICLDSIPSFSLLLSSSSTRLEMTVTLAKNS